MKLLSVYGGRIIDGFLVRVYLGHNWPGLVMGVVDVGGKDYERRADEKL